MMRVRGRGHNRWHPSVAPIATVASGESVELELLDGLAGQVTSASREADLDDFDMGICHPLTGPVALSGAEPGDVVDVEILEIEPGGYGATVVLPGYGLLGDLDLVTKPLIVNWTIDAGLARSPQLPGVVIRGAPFLGVIGVAPSQDSLHRFTERERKVERDGGVAYPPSSDSAYPEGGPVASDGLRTVPPRETGGNLDMKRAVAGSVVSMRVDVPGGLVSVGDPHFAQGDGECCGSAIETVARARLRLSLRKASEGSWQPRFPTVRVPASRQEPPSAEMLYTTGTSSGIDGAGGDRALTTAARAALVEMHDYLAAERGLSSEQAYALMSVAVDLQVSEVVNAPNALVSAALPLDVFES